MHSTDFAPVLSATSSRDSVWIISIIPNLHQIGRGRWLRPLAPSFLISLGPVVFQHEPLTPFSLGRYFTGFNSEALYYEDLIVRRQALFYLNLE
jgi:hypothetical protein